MRRVAALLFAVLVISLAMEIRAHRAKREDDRPVERRRDETYDRFERDEVDLLCAEELRVVCETRLALLGFKVRIEAVGLTLDRLSRGEGFETDAWLTFRPFDQMAASAATDPAMMGPPLAVVARSPVVLSGPRSAVEALDALCPDPAGRFACAATARPKAVTLHDPRTSAAGLLALASLVYAAGWVGQSEGLEDQATREGLRSFVQEVRRSQAPYEDAMRIEGDTVALTLEAEVLAAVRALDYDEQETFDAAAVRYPIDVRAAEVVVVPALFSSRTADLARVLASDDVARAFSRAGYQVEGKPHWLVEYVPAFRGRPTVRTDLAYSPVLLGDLRVALA
ncbi:MAG: substrate-binding domain-containing protein [Actinobacteria bacterium]|nr:substrate-binding domain-containing protein [Actinomycetota bacterium]